MQQPEKIGPFTITSTMEKDILLRPVIKIYRFFNTTHQRRKVGAAIFIILITVFACYGLYGVANPQAVSARHSTSVEIQTKAVLETKNVPAPTFDWRSQPHQSLAWYACRKLIEDKEFLPTTDAEEYDLQNVSLQADNKYQIKIYYEKQDSLYRCTIQALPDKQWNEISLYRILPTSNPHIETATNILPFATQKPTYPPSAMALCNDGTYSYSANHRGVCSHHGGVAKWFK